MAYSLETIGMLPFSQKNFFGDGHSDGRKGPRSRGPHRGYLPPHLRNGFNRNNRSKGKQGSSPNIIEPLKIFISNIPRTASEDSLKNHLSSFVKLENLAIIKGRNNSKRSFYGFIKLKSEDDVKRLLTLEEDKCYFGGNYLSFKPARMQFKVPGMVGFKRMPLSDRDFDLEPVNPSRPSIHMLIDDALLKILEYLPVDNLIRVESVCRRWQSLVHFSFRRKASQEIKGDLSSWFLSKSLAFSLPTISKVLILCGEVMTELIIGEESDSLTSQGKLLRVIGQLCPALESLTVTCFDINDYFLRDLIIACPNLKKVSFKDHSNFNESHLQFLLANLPSLQWLHLEEAEIQGDCFYLLPETLEYLSIPRCAYVNQEKVSLIPGKCPLLKVLRLDRISIPSSVLMEIGKNCPNIVELGVEVVGDNPTVDLQAFKNLKILNFVGCMYSLNSIIKSLPHLEELHVDGLIAESDPDFIDFSIMPNIRVLSFPNRCFTLSYASLKSIGYCSQIEKLKFKGTEDHKSGVIEIIRRCPSLKELDCSTITLYESDIQRFVEANKRRNHRLKFVIGLDRGAMEQIEELSDAKYDVNMFDATNLFSDLHIYDEFEELLDNLTEYDTDESIDTSDYMYPHQQNFDFIHSFPGVYYLEAESLPSD